MTLEIPKEIPSWVVTAVAGPWPEGDEDALRRLGAAWEEIGNAITAVAQLTGEARREALSAIEGQTGDALEEHGIDLDGDLKHAADASYGLSEQCMHNALSTEYSKYVIIGSLVALVLQLGIDAFVPGVGQLHGAAATAATRLTVRAAVRELITRLGTEGARAAAARLVRVVAFKGVTLGAVQGGAIPLVAQAVQMTGPEHYRTEFDWSGIGLGVVSGAAAGAAGEFFGVRTMMGLERRLANKVTADATRSRFQQAGVRLAGAGVGGGGVAGAVAGVVSVVPFTGQLDMGWDHLLPGMVGGVLGSMPHALRGPAGPQIGAPVGGNGSHGGDGPGAGTRVSASPGDDGPPPSIPGDDGGLSGRPGDGRDDPSGVRNDDSTDTGAPPAGERDAADPVRTEGEGRPETEVRAETSTRPETGARNAEEIRPARNEETANTGAARTEEGPGSRGEPSSTTRAPVPGEESAPARAADETRSEPVAQPENEGTGVRPESVVRPGDEGEPGAGVRPENAARPGEDGDPGAGVRPDNVARPGEEGDPGAGVRPDNVARPGDEGESGTAVRPDNVARPGDEGESGTAVRPDNVARPGDEGESGTAVRPDDAARPENVGRLGDEGEPGTATRPESVARPGDEGESGTTTRPETAVRPEGEPRPDNAVRPEEGAGLRPHEESGSTGNRRTDVEARTSDDPTAPVAVRGDETAPPRGREDRTAAPAGRESGTTRPPGRDRTAVPPRNGEGEPTPVRAPENAVTAPRGRESEIPPRHDPAETTTRNSGDETTARRDADEVAPSEDPPTVPTRRITIDDPEVARMVAGEAPGALRVEGDWSQREFIPPLRDGNPRVYSKYRIIDMWENKIGRSMTPSEIRTLELGCVGISSTVAGHPLHPPYNLMFSDPGSYPRQFEFEKVLAPLDRLNSDMNNATRSLAEVRKSRIRASLINRDGSNDAEVRRLEDLEEAWEKHVGAIRKAAVKEVAKLSDDFPEMEVNREIAMQEHSMRTQEMVQNYKKRFEDILEREPATREEFLQMVAEDPQLSQLRNVDQYLPPGKPSEWDLVMYAKHFYSGQEHATDAAGNPLYYDNGFPVGRATDPNPDLFRPDPETGQVDMSGDLMVPKGRGMGNFDFGVYLEDIDAWVNANHMEYADPDHRSKDPMKAFVQTSEDFHRYAGYYDSAVIGLAFRRIVP